MAQMFVQYGDSPVHVGGEKDEEKHKNADIKYWLIGVLAGQKHGWTKGICAQFGVHECGNNDECHIGKGN